MIPSDHFTKFYNEVFKFLETQGDDALQAYFQVLDGVTLAELTSPLAPAPAGRASRPRTGTPVRIAVAARRKG